MTSTSSPRTEAATQAFVENDSEKSKTVHDTMKVATEDHGGLASEYIKSIIFGGLDGVITTFSTIASVAGGGLPLTTVLVLGFGNLIADGIAMGFGDGISSKAEYDFLVMEKKRGRKLIESGRTQEVVDTLVKKGLEREDATEIMTIVAKPAYIKFAEEFVLVEELEQEVPDDPWGPVKEGSVTFVSFLVFGAIPLWVYVIIYGAKYEDVNGAFGISAAACALSLFALGWTQGSVTRQSRLKHGIYMMINGSLASAAAYLVGWGIMQAIGNGSGC